MVVFFNVGQHAENWLHQISKSKKKMGPRVNITFRRVDERTANFILKEINYECLLCFNFTSVNSITIWTN